ncbi:peptidylprolyl isomerase [Erythrobacter sp. SCSIO 43205]|uniref:peptidylprolyl isomerase n=1 Tax=Erythrobacter sp. SCSIO 43205 TaxID=2779361 RepID=UPI001CA9FED6|nr:peptidylprolyl isomerase [Erythrobacter sp. SCSIO 43205]UAB77735.1 peptidylprolyl isomerase [Erythrobacter sp. SCSIO 43205]
MKHICLAAAASIALATPSLAEDEAPVEEQAAPSPNEIVNAAPSKDWVQIAAEDLLVMTLAPTHDGKRREVVIQLMPAPFSQGWVENIRTLARAKWYDGISVNRVQDNYVVQWGDPGHDNPEGEGIETKPLPEGLNVMVEDDYTSRTKGEDYFSKLRLSDAYAGWAAFLDGWPVGTFYETVHSLDFEAWPVHCYGMVGVGRNYSPDTGSGAELYTVIGHAPRHLDRNIALAGRIISGMEHLSSLPRGSGVLGFYTEEEANLRTPILSIRVASDLPESQRPQFEYLSTESETFAAYAEARANRRDPFFIVPAGGADICNIPVPIREVAGAE